MRQENESRQFRSLVNVAAMGVVVAVAVLTASFLVPAAHAKDKPEDLTRVYTHTYDEVFQAAQEAVERMGCSVTGTDKDKGTITGTGKCAPFSNQFNPNGFVKVDFQIQIESVSAKPETRATISFIGKYKRFSAAKLRDGIFVELQKVLATYK